MKNKLTASLRSLASSGFAGDLSPARAKSIQEELRAHWEGRDRLGKIRTVAGLDASFVLTRSQALQSKPNPRLLLRQANRAIGCVVVYLFPEMQPIASATAVVPLRFPYIPGLLSFREIPALLAALEKLDTLPDLLFCDGQGYAHPRRMGLATHLGILLDRPTIGCAKSLLLGTHAAVPTLAGCWTPLLDSKTGKPDGKDSPPETIGAVLRTRTGVRPVYVSQGHRIGLPTAIDLTLRVTSGFRIPTPTRDADRLASETKQKLLSRYV